MGGSFGFVNGGSAELVRQQQRGEELDIGRIMQLGLLDAGVGALGAGAGIKGTDPRFQARLARMFETIPQETPTESGEHPSLSMGPTARQTPAGIRNLRLLSALRPQTSVASTVPVGRPLITINAMAPLLVGNQSAPEGQVERQAWEQFEGQLEAARRLGIDGISTDVWWGKIEPKPGEFNWNYYDLLSSTITKHGLKWVPILSFHQCGGNVGDNVYQPIPFWIWSLAQRRANSNNPDVAKFVSEQGNSSPEYVSYWATPLVLDRYANVMREFQNRYSGRAHNISEINISLGPAGELRFPSYNSHDNGTGYPTRGALQAYSELARTAFVDFAIKKYGNAAAVREAWGEEFGQTIEPPRDAARFFQEGKHMSTQYGRDFFDFYSGTLGQHYNMVMGEATKIFSTQGAPFAGIDLGMKIPGLHWRVGENQGGNIVLGDRLTELSAGLIRTSGGDWGSDSLGRGYRPLMETIAQLRPERGRIVPHFTALEMADGQDRPEVKSLPHTLPLGRRGSQSHGSAVEGRKRARLYNLRSKLLGQNALGP
ncbi:MAG: family 14 glycosylhydrolase, partial [Cyanobacteria bacterium]|nr:family 14 glycosylhydrolase [Cyanobacteriota bacterium]